ncbi:hypothetical protein CPB84DRAFT_386547 [Gymnopilus junonius]|uniref:Uncharacterized protein n=1 Tax=Gymnopilus junonius TaxID=109634 RepID=A0A9P5NV60_GYMJU|nr:hypothetical protein CPB84DRAFT_386547 [Gymnopilus junonius]
MQETERTAWSQNMVTTRRTPPWTCWRGIPRMLLFPPLSPWPLQNVNLTKRVWPFHTLSEAERRVSLPVDFSQTPISAIFVYHDPRNWALDIQVTCDTILSGGIIGGPSRPLEQQKAPVKLVFCNPDLLWKSDFERPRLGQGRSKWRSNPSSR